MYQSVIYRGKQGYIRDAFSFAGQEYLDICIDGVSTVTPDTSEVIRVGNMSLEVGQLCSNIKPSISVFSHCLHMQHIGYSSCLAFLLYIIIEPPSSLVLWLDEKVSHPQSLYYISRKLTNGV